MKILVSAVLKNKYHKMFSFIVHFYLASYKCYRD